MNIVFAYPTVFDPIIGGVEKVTDMLAKELHSRGHNIFYIHHHRPASQLNLPFQTFYFPSEDYKSPLNKDYYTHFLNEYKIDIIINQCGAHKDSILYNYTEGTKAKVISVIHFNPAMSLNHYWNEISALRDNTIIERIKQIARCAFYFKIKSNYRKKLNLHYRWLFKNTDKICLLSDRFRGELISLTGENEYDDKKIISIPNPAYTQESIPEDKKKQILWVGRFDLKQKRPDLCVKIWKQIQDRLPDWELIMVGDGKDFDYIKKKAFGLKRISFTGYTDPIPYYRQAKILMLTSAFEGWGMVLTEAMSYGIIPIAFNSFESIKDIIKDSRQLIKPFDTALFANQLIKIISDKKLMNELSVSISENIKGFCIEKIADKWETVLMDLNNQ